MASFDKLKNDWVELESGLRIHESGKGIVSLRACGDILEPHIEIVESKDVETGLKPVSTTMKANSNEEVKSPANSNNENSQYLIKPFRMLSAVLIPGHWIDFSKEGVLKKALPLFDNVTIFPNHNPDIENWLGIAINPRYAETGKAPGIESDFKIDISRAAKLGDLDKALKMSPPAIRSCSVGISFDALKSHPEMDRWDFMDLLGREVDGQVVRYIVSAINRISEVSLVYAGADPNARSLSFHSMSSPNSFVGDLNKDKSNQLNEIVTTDSRQKISGMTLNKEDDLNIKLTAALISMLALDVSKLGIKPDTEITQEQFDLLVKEFAAKNKELADKVENISKLAEHGKLYVDEVRKEAEKHYRLCAGEKPSEQILKVLQTGDIETVKALGEEYKAGALALHPVTGSRQSSASDEKSKEVKASESDVSKFKTGE